MNIYHYGLICVFLSIILLHPACKSTGNKDKIELEITEKYDNGKPKLIVELKKIGDKQEKSKTTAYHPNGEVWIETFYKDGLKDGPYKVFDTSGNIKDIGEYKNGLMQGDYIGYFSDGSLQIEGQYRDDTEMGKWTRYYETGQKRDEVYYNNGLRHGNARTWYNNGQLKISGVYVNDQPSGTWTYWDSAGKLSRQYVYEGGVVIDSVLVE